MDQTFNTAEILEDKDLTIAQLRATIKTQSEALTAVELRVQNTDALRIELLKEMDELKAANKVLSAQLEAPSFDQLMANMVRDRIESMVEVYFESEQFTEKVQNAMEDIMRDYESTLGDRINDMLECSGEIERCIETALDEAISNVHISFR